MQEYSPQSRSRVPSEDRRNQDSHQAILQAALAILESQGYRALTIEGIATKARVGKTTIYRWWPSKAAIVLEAFTQQAATLIPLPDERSLKEDLYQFLSTSFEVLQTLTGTVVRSLMAEAQFDAVFAREFNAIFINARRSALITLFQRGIARGELASNTPLEFLADMFYGPMWYRLLNQHAPLDEEFAHQLVDFILVHHFSIQGDHA